MSQGSEGNPPLRIRLSREQWAEVRRRAGDLDPATWARLELLGPELGQPARRGPRRGAYVLLRRTSDGAWYHRPTPEAPPSWGPVGTPMPRVVAEAAADALRAAGVVVEVVEDDSGRDPRNEEG